MDIYFKKIVTSIVKVGRGCGIVLFALSERTSCDLRYKTVWIYHQLYIERF